MKNQCQDLLLGDYVPGNGITFSSSDNNYKVVLRGYSQSLFESKRFYYDGEIQHIIGISSNSTTIEMIEFSP